MSETQQPPRGIKSIRETKWYVTPFMSGDGTRGFFVYPKDGYNIRFIESESEQVVKFEDAAGLARELEQIVNTLRRSRS